MALAHETLQRGAKSRIEMLKEKQTCACVNGCGGRWKEACAEVLSNNGLTNESFSDAVYELLLKGRGKYRNIMITGPANCGKTFILAPLHKIYNCFSNPASSTFAWIWAESAEVIFLNDFRWSAPLIPWHDMLLLLEGQLVHFAAPKSHFTQDIALDKDTPIFCTTKRPLVYVKGGCIDEKETEMMSVRWKTFSFYYQIPAEQQRELPPCSHCFADFILRNTSLGHNT
jgi:hypothetical protein